MGGSTAAGAAGEQQAARLPSPAPFWGGAGARGAPGGVCRGGGAAVEIDYGALQARWLAAACQNGW
jgi:hypothetical protein